MHEFEIIKKYFSKLSLDNKNSLKLNDDVFFDKSKELVISDDNITTGVTNVLDKLKLKYKVYSPTNKEEYHNSCDILLGMFTVDSNGKKIEPKYSYEEGIKKIFE